MCFSMEGLYNISRRGLSRVAYPGQGDARARVWDERGVEHPRLSISLCLTPNPGGYWQGKVCAYGNKCNSREKRKQR